MSDIIANIQAALIESATLKQRCAEVLAEDIARGAEVCVEAYRAGSKTLICGNGGSAADAQHFAAELTGRYLLDRRALPSLALTVDTSALTAIGNDLGFENVFARQVEAYGNEGDVLIAISTSGNSANVIAAIEKARALNMRVVGLSGRDGGKMSSLCDVNVVVPHHSTARIQEVHITVLHAWCETVERAMAQP